MSQRVFVLLGIYQINLLLYTSAHYGNNVAAILKAMELPGDK